MSEGSFGYENLIAVTDRRMCGEEFEKQVRRVAACRPAGLILREKDLADAEYIILAGRIRKICEAESVPLFVHGRLAAARAVGCRNLHLPLPVLRAVGGKPQGIDMMSVSCHSREDVESAEALGADRILLGTIFPTGSKPGLPGKGISFVREICAGTSLPVFAIGGITMSNLAEVMAAGAAGGCMMSGFMKLR